MSELETHSGGCQCGAVRYRITGTLGYASICHCRMCQKAFGNVGAPLIGVARVDFQWTRGRPAEFRSSPSVARGFCAACGTPLYMLEDGDPKIEIAICTLDDPDAATLSAQVGVESKVAWFDSLSHLPPQTTNQNNPLAAKGRYKSLQHPDHDTDHWP